MRADDLSTFVGMALERGVPRTQIEQTLLAAGWTPKQTREALAGFADVAFPVPVPKPRPYTDARDAFLYGLLFVALGLSAYHLGMLLFQFIEHAFPAGAVLNLRNATRWPIAILVVATPVLLYTSWLVNRDIRIDPSRRSSKSRLQMIYFTLFVCAAVVVGVLAGLVYNLLGDELTIRFVLKCLVTAGVACAIFLYYRRDARVPAT